MVPSTAECDPGGPGPKQYHIIGADIDPFNTVGPVFLDVIMGVMRTLSDREVNPEVVKFPILKKRNF